MDYRLKTYSDLTVGQSAFFTKTITEADLSHFIAITGDVNPLHVDAEFARRTFFKRRIAHGLLSAALFSTLVGMLLPGTGAIYRSQTLNFLKPVFIGDTLKASLEITAIDPAAETIDMVGCIANQRNETVVEGTATAGLLRGLDG